MRVIRAVGWVTRALAMVGYGVICFADTAVAWGFTHAAVDRHVFGVASNTFTGGTKIAVFRH